MHRSIWRRTRIPGACLALLVIAVIAAEGVLRLNPQLLPETARLRLHWRATIDDIPKISHPEFGFVHPANMTGKVQGHDLAFDFTTDENGFRNPAPWQPGVEIVALGDSQTFGFGVDDDDTWMAVLGRAIAGEVVNLSVNGSAPLQQLRIIEAYWDEVQPKTVLLGLFPGNALAAAAEYQNWLDAGKVEPFMEFRRRPFDQPLWKRSLLWLTKQSHVVLFLRTVADRMRTPYPGFTTEMADGGRLSFTPYIYAGHAGRAQSGETAFEQVLDAVERIKEHTEDEGSRFRVVLFPTKEEIYLPSLDRPYPDVTGPFAAGLAARGVPVIDLLPAFRARAAAGERLFLEIDMHPNEAGYALIAQEVLQQLKSGGQQVAHSESDQPPGSAPR